MAEADSDTDVEALERELAALEEEESRLAAEVDTFRSNNAKLRSTVQSREATVKELKTAAVELQRAIEEEEEYITNGLIKKLDQLKKEKEQLALQVDCEEEFLTNSLQRKLSQLQREKEELEKHLHKEERYIVNKLQKQLRQVAEQKAALEQELDDLRGTGVPLQQLVGHTNDYKAAIGEGAMQIEGVEAAPLMTPHHHHDSDVDSTLSESSTQRSTASQPCKKGSQIRRSQASQEAMIQQLRKEVSRLQQLVADSESKASSYREKCKSLRVALEQLSQDNFLKDVRAQRIKETLDRVAEERNQLFVTSELITEKDITRHIRRPSIQSTTAVSTTPTPPPKLQRSSSGPFDCRATLDKLSLRAHTEHILQSPALSPDASPAHSGKGTFATPGGAPPSPPTGTGWGTPPVTPRTVSPRSPDLVTPTFRSNKRTSSSGHVAHHRPFAGHRDIGGSFSSTGGLLPPFSPGTPR